MIFDKEENLHSKSKTLCTGLLHRRVIWSRHMDIHNETSSGMRFFHRGLELGNNKKIFQN